MALGVPPRPINSISKATAGAFITLSNSGKWLLSTRADEGSIGGNTGTISQNAYMIVVADPGAGIVGRHHQRLGPSAAGSTDLSQCRRAVFGDWIECSHTARGEHAHH